MRKVAIAALVVAFVLMGMLLMGMAQNEGCLPWKDPVGTQGSPFSGTEDNVTCR